MNIKIRMHCKKCRKVECFTRGYIFAVVKTAIPLLLTWEVKTIFPHLMYVHTLKSANILKTLIPNYFHTI